jgi:uncharacterized Tic20 family protein
MSPPGHEPILNKGPSAKAILIVTVVAAILFGIGAAIEGTGRSADERVAATFFYLLGFALVVLDVILVLIALAKRKKTPPAA